LTTFITTPKAREFHRAFLLLLSPR